VGPSGNLFVTGRMGRVHGPSLRRKCQYTTGCALMRRAIPAPGSPVWPPAPRPPIASGFAPASPINGGCSCLIGEFIGTAPLPGRK
jgi:hypothetical protein